MTVTEVTDEGLRVAGARCADAAARLATATPAPPVAPSCQDTSAATATAGARLAATAAVLSAQVVETGAKLAEGGAAFATAEHTAAQRYTPAGRPVLV